ncbi:probable histone-arginine methyltransferase 1.3 [Tanacetum coccineum]
MERCLPPKASLMIKLKHLAKMYFHYYGQLLHQQNMMQDYVRTGSYYAAVIENQVDFAGRVVVDVGTGSGILSLFAAQDLNIFLISRFSSHNAFLHILELISKYSIWVPRKHDLSP